MRTELIEAYYNGPEYMRKLRLRMELMQECEDELPRARIIADIWAVNPVRFIEDICFTKLVEYNNSIKPFFLFPYQIDILWKLVEAENSGQDTELLIDKLRGMGMTWLIAAYMYWRWMFTPNWTGFILSRTETEVDDGTDDPGNSIFGKLRFFINHTPGWLIPDGFESKKKRGTVTDATLRLMNPQMSSSIIGSSTNANAGRSKRFSFVFVDECFYIDKFLSVWRALQSVARVKVFVSSVKQGRVAEKFKDKCKQEGNYITLEWKDHPWKDQEWFDEQMKKAEFDPEVVKEVMVDYSVNIKDQYYPEIRRAKIEPIQYSSAHPLYLFVDFGKQDLTVLGWAQFYDDWLNILDCYANSQKPVKWYVPFMNPQWGIEHDDWYNPPQREFLAHVRSWQKPKAYFGEQAHFIKTMPLNISIAQVLFKYRIRLICNTKATKYEPRRHATSLLLPKTRFNADSDGAMELYDALAQSRYTGTKAPISRETAMKPRHDEEIGDYRAAFENLCVNIPRILRSQPEEAKENFRKENFAANLIKYLRT